MDRDFEDLRETKLSSEQVYDGILLKVFSDKVSLPNGHVSSREFIRHDGAVSIAALTDDGRIVMEHQFRYPQGRVLLEIPAGKLDGPDEDPLEAAARELREETGISADKMTYLGGMIPSCAYTTELVHMFMAEGLHFGDSELDENEFLEFGLMPLDEVFAMVMNGEITDSKTQISVLKVMALRKGWS